MRNTAQLLQWFQTQKRALPWRQRSDMYARWLSEIILQQTRVNQGVAYYSNFVETYPTVEHLAAETEENVLKMWQGLGYYSRARNLHKTAKIIAFEHNGSFPQSYKELLKLPGIGKYTAGALASIVAGEPVPAIDGNALRVYSRYYGIKQDISEATSFKTFFDIGLEAIPVNKAGDFNEAIMELGSTICLPKNPLCHQCPLQSNCYAYAYNQQHSLPVKSSKIKVREESIDYLVFHKKGHVLFHHRKNKGIWQNLYDFPTSSMLPISVVQESTPLQEITHLLTHKKLQIAFYPMQEEFVESIPHNCRWIEKDQIGLLPVPKPIADFLEKHIL
ncbi:MAG: A/G-specific adenine glycosylase [Weeksellaceae bacterium]|nr:A/G-specific adenine glycosylase [Weeksellaceae bacterium]